MVEQKRNGFTLVEMMVVLSIFTVVMGIAFTALSLNETYRDLVLIKIQLYRANKIAVSSISMELERSNANSWSIQDNNPDIIRFQIPLINSIDVQYDIPWGGRQAGTDYPDNFIQYRLDTANHHLVREIVDVNWSIVGGTQSEIITENITDLQFTSLNPNYIQINLSAERMTLTPRRPISANIESTVYLRN